VARHQQQGYGSLSYLILCKGKADRDSCTTVRGKNVQRGSVSVFQPQSLGNID
jgi:hypothetical protein